MSDLRSYLLGLTAAALLCSVVKALMPKQGSIAQVLRLILGLLMVLAAVRPWVDISMDDLFGWTQSITTQGERVASQGTALAENAYRQGIKERVQAYILDEAERLGANIEATVELSDEQIPLPARVRISGALSPYAKQQLTQWITQELGISQEEIEWS